MKKYRLFLVGVNSGKVELVETLGENPHIKDGIYIRYVNGGGTDTTKERFLVDIPNGLKIDLDNDYEDPSAATLELEEMAKSDKKLAVRLHHQEEAEQGEL